MKLRAWTVPQAIFSGSVRTITGFSVAPRGSAAVAWLGFNSAGGIDGGGGNVLDYEPGTGWSSPAPIVTPQLPFTGGPKIALGKDDAFLAWTADGMLVASRRTDAGWPTATPVGATAISGGVDLATDGNGNAFVAWGHYSGTVNRVSVASHAPLSGWTAPVSVDNGVESYDPRVVACANGTSFATHIEQGGSWITHANRYLPGSGWQANTPLEFNETLAMNASGAAIGAQRFPVRSKRFVPGVGWFGADQIKNLDGGEAAGLHIAFNNNGEAILGLLHRYGNIFNIYDSHASHFRPDAGWSPMHPLGGVRGPAQQLPDAGFSTPGGLSGEAGQVQVAMDDFGTGVAAWTQSGTRMTLWTSQFDLATGWAPPQQRDATLTGSVGEIRLGMDAAGNIVLVWNEAGATGKIWAAHFR